jgi:pimeloyl-ACP methyl ester carboxylesterase
MTILGYDKFGAQGGDWGSFITSRLAVMYPERLTGIHLNLLPLRRDPKLITNPTPEEQKYLDQLNHFLKEETGYQWIQGTKPTTLSYGLTDSPAGLAAWIVEKFRSWTDNDGTIESVISRDDLLTNISLYWFSGAIGSSFFPYFARMHRPWPIPDGKTIDVPMSYAEFPREILSPPRSLAERRYTNIKRWTRMEKGGHFAALERPAILSGEIRKALVTDAFD